MMAERRMFAKERAGEQYSALRDHLELLDDVDIAFEEFMRKDRAYKKAKKTYEEHDPRVREAAGEVNQADHIYRDLRQLAMDRFAKLSAAEKELFVESNAATKKGRAALTRELIKSTEVERENAAERAVERAEESTEEQEMEQEIARAESDFGTFEEVEALPERIVRPPEPEPTPEARVVDLILAGETQDLQRLPQVPRRAPATSFLDRVRSSRIAKVFGITALLGGSVQVAREGAELIESSRQSTEASVRVHEESLKNTISFLDEEASVRLQEIIPSLDEQIQIGQLTGTRGEFIPQVNEWYTNLLTEKRVPISHLFEDCRAEGTDGEVLDAVNCDLLYGDQIPFNDQAKKSFAALEGLSLEEYDFLGDVLRDSVYVKPTGMTFGANGVLGLVRYDEGHIPSNFRPERDELYKEYLREAKIMVHDILEDTNVDGLNREMREDLLEKTKEVIRAEVEFSNQLTVTAALLEGFYKSEYCADSLKTGLVDVYSGEQYDSALSRTVDFLNRANAASSVPGLDSGFVDARILRVSSLLEYAKTIDYQDSDFYDTFKGQLDSGR